jgi:hypothetical protein
MKFAQYAQEGTFVDDAAAFPPAAGVAGALSPGPHVSNTFEVGRSLEVDEAVFARHVPLRLRMGSGDGDGTVAGAWQGCLYDDGHIVSTTRYLVQR